MNIEAKVGEVIQVDEDGTCIVRFNDGSIRSVQPNDPNTRIVKIEGL